MYQQSRFRTPTIFTSAGKNGTDHVPSPLILFGRTFGKSSAIFGAVWMFLYALLFLIQRDWFYGIWQTTFEQILGILIGPLLVWTGCSLRRHF